LVPSVHLSRASVCLSCRVARTNGFSVSLSVPRVIFRTWSVRLRCATRARAATCGCSPARFVLPHAVTAYWRDGRVRGTVHVPRGPGGGDTPLTRVYRSDPRSGTGCEPATNPIRPLAAHDVRCGCSAEGMRGDPERSAMERARDGASVSYCVHDVSA
jgi:hypothetical protein